MIQAAAFKDLAEREAQVRENPQDPRRWLELGIAHDGAGQSDRALQCLEHAATLDPHLAEAQYNCGVILYARGDLQAALERYRAAVAAKPDFLLALCNLGVTLEALGETEAALEAYDEARRRHPNDADAYWNKALLLLRNGRFAEGWRYFEWRWSTGRLGQARHIPGKPLWLGGVSIAGKTLLLTEEQGLGDMIQFVRFIPDVQALGAKVVLQTFLPLTALFKDQFDVEAYGVDEPLPAFDLHCPLMSLPLALGLNDPACFKRAPYLVAPPARRAAWVKKAPRDGRPRIGFAWKGNPRHEGDRARSVRLTTFTQLFRDDLEFISLQREVNEQEISILAQAGVPHWGANLRDFADTAALVETCDLVISVDTALAHLTGAMGRPLWLLLPARCDWRWGRRGTTSAWYPSARLFRGRRQGDWTNVVRRVAQAATTWRGSSDEGGGGG